MPGVDGGDEDGVDIFSFEKLAVIAVGIFLVNTSELARGVEPFLPNITDGGLDDVVGAGVFFLEAHMGHALAADTDIANGDAVVGADDPASRGRLGLAVDGRLDDSGSGNGCSRGRQ